MVWGYTFEYMKWPVLWIGVVLVGAVVIFAVTYGNPKNTVTLMPEPVISTSTGGILGTTTSTFSSSGVLGSLKVACNTDVSDPACASQIYTIQAYQGISSVGLFKTTPDGKFKADLPEGKYELRVDTASSTHCSSVGVVVPAEGYISTNISCATVNNQ